MTSRTPSAARRCLRAAVACLLAAGAARAEPLSGSWCGIGEQSNPDGSKSFWSANLLLSGGEGRMEYPSLDCGGTLTLERSEGSVHLYRERITYGRDRCLDGGLVAVEKRGASVRWEWTGKDGAADVKATAVLSPNCPEKPGNVDLRDRRRSAG